MLRWPTSETNGQPVRTTFVGNAGTGQNAGAQIESRQTPTDEGQEDNAWIGADPVGSCTSFTARPVSGAAMIGCQDRREAYHRTDKITTAISLIGLILSKSGTHARTTSSRSRINVTKHTELITLILNYVICKRILILAWIFFFTTNYICWGFFSRNTWIFVFIKPTNS